MKVWMKFLVLSGGLTSFIVFAHEGHHHSDKMMPATEIQKQAYEKINQEYLKSVKLIFSSKCMNCHSSQTNYPFYYKMPFIKGIIDKDIAESRKHIDLTEGFPFKGHGSIAEDLEAIKKQISENEMPPLRYKIMHPGSGLNDQEKQTVFRWLDDSLKILRTLPPTDHHKAHQ